MRIIKIRYSCILLFIVMLPFVEPRMFNEVEFWVNLHMHEIYDLARYIALGGILLYNFIYLKVKYSPVTKLVILYFLLMILSTIINDGALRTVITYFFTACGICIFADLFIYKYGIVKYCQHMASLLLILVMINCITIWLFPGGLYANTLNNLYRPQNWFFGYKNSHIYSYLPCLFFVFITAVQRSKKIKARYVALALIVLISIVISDSTTSLVLMLCFCIYLIINVKRNRNLIENPFVQYVFILIANYALIFTNIISSFKDYVNAIFNKYSTVESRTVIWNNALKYIHESPLLGKGIEDYEVSLVKIYGQAHNKLLDVTYVSGIAGLVCFLIILIYIMRLLNNSEKKLDIKICTIILLCYNILFLTEAQRDNPLYFAVLVSIYHICNMHTHTPLRLQKNEFKKGEL